MFPGVPRRRAGGARAAPSICTVAFPLREPWRQQPRARCHGARSVYTVHHGTRRDTPRCTSTDNAAYRSWRSTAQRPRWPWRQIINAQLFRPACLYSLEVICIALYSFVLGASVSDGRWRQKVSGVRTKSDGCQRQKVTGVTAAELPARSQRLSENVGYPGTHRQPWAGVVVCPCTGLCRDCMPRRMPP